jgi:hypothetical protein
MSEILTKLTEYKSSLFSSGDTELSIFCFRMNAGFFGGERSTMSLFSIEITAAMAGLSMENSCTHRSPMCIDLKIYL